MRVLGDKAITSAAGSDLRTQPKTKGKYRKRKRKNKVRKSGNNWKNIQNKQ